MDTPSLRQSPVASVFPTLSLPAKSTKWNLDVMVVEVEVLRPGVEEDRLGREEIAERND